MQKSGGGRKGVVDAARRQGYIARPANASCAWQPPSYAQVAELVDAQVSGTCGSNVVEVRVFSWAPTGSSSRPDTPVWRASRNSCRTARSISIGDDLPEAVALGPVVAVDTETMGLHPHRDRLCLVQFSAGDGQSHLVQLIPPTLAASAIDCPNLKRLLADPSVVKLMHFGRFDVAVLQHYLGIAVGAGEVHQDRRQAGAHLHRQARPEGSVPGSAGRRAVEAAAKLRLGRDGTDARATRLRRLRRAAPTRAVGEAGSAADPGGKAGTGRGVLRVSCQRAAVSTCSATISRTSSRISPETAGIGWPQSAIHADLQAPVRQ